MFNYIAYNNINGEEISNIAADYAGELITNSTKTAYDPAAEAMYRRYRDAIKAIRSTCRQVLMESWKHSAVWRV